MRPRNCGQIPARQKDVTLLLNVQTEPGAHLFSVQGIPTDKKRLGHVDDHLPHVLVRLSTSGALPPLPHMTSKRAQQTIFLRFFLLLKTHNFYISAVSYPINIYEELLIISYCTLMLVFKEVRYSTLSSHATVIISTHYSTEAL